MEVMPGYKQTEVGVIPEDWELKELGNIASITAGGTPSRKNPAFWGGDIPWITMSQIDFNKITSAEQYITEIGLKNSAAKLLAPGTLLLALYGQGKTRGKVCILGIQAATNQACASIDISSSFSREFVFHFLASQYDAIRGLSNSGSQENLNGQIVKSIPIPLPPTKAEQEAIAEVLSISDALIETLERLIAKKRLLKQGVMQKLLTGKKRLPGFGGEWKTGVLSDCFELVSTRNAELNDNVVTISAQLGFVRQEEFFKKRVASRVLENYYLIERDQFAYNRSYSYGYPFGAIKRLTKFDKGVVTTLYICFTLKPDVGADPGFFEHYFEAGLLNTGLSAVASEGGRAHGLLNITKADFLSRELKFPSLPEQTAIAAIISSMDAEIALQEAQLAKYRQLKQGLMQKLLTGKIRLV